MFNFNWSRIELIPDVELAWTFFNYGFTQIINRHAPFKRFRIKGRDNPWFSPELADIIHQRNLAWAKARKTGISSDWLVFTTLRNRCSSFINQAKGLIMLLRFSKNAEEGTPSSPWNALCVLSVSPRRAFDGLTCTS